MSKIVRNTQNIHGFVLLSLTIPAKYEFNRYRIRDLGYDPKPLEYLMVCWHMKRASNRNSGWKKPREKPRYRRHSILLMVSTVGDVWVCTPHTDSMRRSCPAYERRKEESW